jgi:hypothetical protein
VSALLALAIQVAAQPSPQGRKMSRARLNVIADGCRAPRKWLKLRGREVVFLADPDGDQTKIACVLRKMNAAIDDANRGMVDDAANSEEN